MNDYLSQWLPTLPVVLTASYASSHLEMDGTGRLLSFFLGFGPFSGGELLVLGRVTFELLEGYICLPSLKLSANIAPENPWEKKEPVGARPTFPGRAASFREGRRKNQV